MSFEGNVMIKNNPINKIVSIVGARPQFIKCAPLSRALRKEHNEILIHSGQHYDSEMSDIFFEELNIPKPDYYLNVGSGTHGFQTGQILMGIEEVLIKEEPEMVLVYGDTNSTLAGALAAVKLHIPVAHVEAGLRSFDRTMPEEINRVVADHVSDLLFCPTTTAITNLRNEGIVNGVHLVGDVMVDAFQFNKKIAEDRSEILKRLKLSKGKYNLITVHRPSNTNNKKHMQAILNALARSGRTTVFPVHPRTRKYLKEYGFWNRLPPNILCIDPLGYLDMLRLLSKAGKVLTDSGGVQKEAYLSSVPCITLRENTEWVETVEDGWNILVGADEEKIFSAILDFFPSSPQRQVFGAVGASDRIAALIDN